MALPATGVIEIRSTATANNVNGGGFNSARGGTDYTLQNAAQLNPTDLTSVLASTTITSAIGGFTSVMVGNYIHITAGTNFVAGWYEIVTFTNANNVVVDRACTVTADGSAGVGYVGGAMSLNSTLDDDLFEIAIAGNVFYIKAGAYTLNESVSIAVAGSVSLEIKIEGYNTTRGDNPTEANRPSIAFGANTFKLGNYWTIKNVSMTGTGTNMLQGADTFSRVINCKIRNSTSTAGINAIFLNGNNCFIFKSEVISYRGAAITNNDTRNSFLGCYLHDSNKGIRFTYLDYNTHITNCIVSDNVHSNIIVESGNTADNILIQGNTIYGAENKLGVGINFAGTITRPRVFNNIISGCVTGVTHPTAGQTTGFDDYNDYNNNTTDVTNWTKGSNDIAVNPAFTSVAQLTGSTATTSGSVLTQSGGDFSTVTDNVDFVYIKSGTGVTVGKYMITSHTSDTVTLDIAPGTNATADKVWQITTGHNFMPTGAI